MLELNNVKYWYSPGIPAVQTARAAITPGVWLLIGRNGSGKTTLLRLLSALLFPKEGSITLDGTDVSRRLPSTLSRIFFLPDDADCPFPTIARMVERHACFYPDFNCEMLRANLADFGLKGTEPFSSLSLGMRRKSLLAYALSLGVDYLLLDEPANGMDIDSKKLISHLIARCVSDDQTVIFSTHNVHDVASIADHLMVMRYGCLEIARPIDEISRRIAFVTSPSPVDGAAYQERFMGAYHAIVANEFGIDTDIDYQLLFSAICSPAGKSLAKFINSEEIQL